MKWGQLLTDMRLTEHIDALYIGLLAVLHIKPMHTQTSTHGMPWKVKVT